MFESPGILKDRLQLLVCLRLLVNTPTELVTSYSIPIIRMSGHFHGLALANYDKALRPTSYPRPSLRLRLAGENSLGTRLRSVEMLRREI